jgi:hypothetical protein
MEAEESDKRRVTRDERKQGDRSQNGSSNIVDQSRDRKGAVEEPRR